MTIAGTTTTNNQIIDGIVVFTLDFRTWIKNVITQGVEFCEVDANIGKFEEVLNPSAVRICYWFP